MSAALPTERRVSHTAFWVRLDGENGEHIRMTVFAGPDVDHQANCGQLTFRTQEAKDFIRLFVLLDEDDAK